MPYLNREHRTDDSLTLHKGVYFQMQIFVIGLGFFDNVLAVEVVTNISFWITHSSDMIKVRMKGTDHDTRPKMEGNLNFP